MICLKKINSYNSLNFFVNFYEKTIMIIQLHFHSADSSTDLQFMFKDIKIEILNAIFGKVLIEQVFRKAFTM